jgi:hypothetical protein
MTTGSDSPNKHEGEEALFLDALLAEWPLNPKSLTVRQLQARNGRQVIQMRIEMGVLQLETEGRPGGDRPFGATTMLHYIQDKLKDAASDYILSEDECFECDREFIQFYHRRVCWLTLKEYDRAAADARHTLALMDLCRQHSPDDAWTVSHEQYRPFVIYHRVQAEAMSLLGSEDPGSAIHCINQAIVEVEEAFAANGDDETEREQLVARLEEMRETLRERFSVGRTLQEQLADAIQAEQYELAAKLRDALANQDRNPR